MAATSAHLPRWATSSSIVDYADSAPMELERLGHHYTTCNGGRGRWFTLRCAAESAHAFIAARFVTTLCLATAVIALIANLA